MLRSPLRCSVAASCPACQRQADYGKIRNKIPRRQQSAYLRTTERSGLGASSVPKLRASSVLGPELRLGPHSDKLCFSLGRHAAKRSFANVRPQAELGTETHS